MYMYINIITVNPEIFAKKLFSLMVLKDIFVTFNIRGYGMSDQSSNDRMMFDFASILFSRNFAYAKIRENKTLAMRSFAKMNPRENFQIYSNMQAAKALTSLRICVVLNWQSLPRTNMNTYHSSSRNVT